MKSLEPTTSGDMIMTPRIMALAILFSRSSHCIRAALKKKGYRKQTVEMAMIATVLNWYLDPSLCPNEEILKEMAKEPYFESVTSAVEVTLKAKKTK